MQEYNLLRPYFETFRASFDLIDNVKGHFVFKVKPKEKGQPTQYLALRRVCKPAYFSDCDFRPIYEKDFMKSGLFAQFFPDTDAIINDPISAPYVYAFAPTKEDARKHILKYFIDNKIYII